MARRICLPISRDKHRPIVVLRRIFFDRGLSVDILEYLSLTVCVGTHTSMTLQRPSAGRDCVRIETPLATTYAKFYSRVFLTSASPRELNCGYPDRMAPARRRALLGVRVVQTIFRAEEAIIQCSNETVAVQFTDKERSP